MRLRSFWIPTLVICGISCALADDLSLYVSRSFNLGHYDASGWKGAPLASEGFYPLGFSKDGWFAYVTHPSGDQVNEENEACPLPPCHDGVSLMNIRCDDQACLSDSPGFDGDTCWCPTGAREPALAKFGIEALNNETGGTFPSSIHGETFSVSIVHDDKLISSEALKMDSHTHKLLPPEKGSPGTEVFLVSKKRGRKLIRTFDDQHEGVEPGSVQAVAWLSAPIPRRIVVVVGYVTAESTAPAVQYLPIGVNLASGFEKDSND